MASYHISCEVTRSWVISIILRTTALLLNIASIGIISALFLKQIQDILFIILVNISPNPLNTRDTLLTKIAVLPCGYLVNS